MNFGTKADDVYDVEALAEKSEIHELFTDAFMKEYTQYATVDELFSELGKSPDEKVTSQSFNTHEANVLIYNKTEFISWPDMYKTAADYYMLKHLLQNSG